MLITTKIGMDLQRPSYPAVINAVQGDQNTRCLEVALYSGGVSWRVPDDVTVAMRYIKSDKTKGYYDSMPDGSSAWSVSDNVISILLAPQMLTVAGPVLAQLELIRGTALLSTYTIQLNVTANPAEGVLSSEDYVNWLQWMKSELDAYIEEELVATAVEEYLEKNPIDIPTKPEDIGAQPAGNYALKEEIPSVPVKSVNGKTGAVQLSAADVKARPDTWMPTAQDVGALPSTYTPPNQTAEQVGADPKGTAAEIVSEHNTDEDAHSDIRLELKQINDRLTAFFDSDDQTLDELSEIVAYITSNKSLIEAVTTSKVSVTDIVNNLTTNVSNKPLSAAQGVVLKGLVDTLSNSLSNYQPKGDYALRNEIPTVPTKVSAFTNDAGYLTEHQDISGKVDVNTDQTLTEDQKAQARNNIGAASQDDLDQLSSEKVIVPDYWKGHLDDRIEDIRAAMERAGRNKSAFLLYSDSHRNNSAQISPVLLEYLYLNTAINKTIFTGDIVHSEPTADTLTDRSIMKYLWEWRRAIRRLKHYSVVGNHDDGNTTNNLFSYDYVYSYLFAPEESNEIVHGGDTYYYFDDASERTRYLCLDTAYEGLTALSSAQTEFINETLISAPSDWRIIVVAHIWYVPDYDQHNVRPIPIVGLSASAETLVTILDNYNARKGDFVSCKATVKLCIGGHVHRDYVDVTPGGIPIILVETDSWDIRGEFTCTAGTITEAAVSGIIVDYNEDKASVIRIGRGNSFTVDLSSGESSEIPGDGGSTTPTYTNVLDTVGYTEGYRLSGSSGEPSLSANHDITGFIPCEAGDLIYLKNVEMPDTTTAYDAHVAFYTADKTYKSGYLISTSALGDNNPYMLEYDDSGNLCRFSATHDGTAYIRISCKNIDETSIITVNEPIG